MAERATWNRMRENFAPAPLTDQIAEIKKQIAITNNVLASQVRRNRLHPTQMAIEMHRLRSILHTLESIEAAPPGAANDAGAPTPAVPSQ